MSEHVAWILALDIEPGHEEALRPLNPETVERDVRR